MMFSMIEIFLDIFIAFNKLIVDNNPGVNLVWACLFANITSIIENQFRDRQCPPPNLLQNIFVYCDFSLFNIV